MEREAAMERWVREEVVGGHTEYLADPSRGVPAEDILPSADATNRMTTSQRIPTC